MSYKVYKLDGIDANDASYLRACQIWSEKGPDCFRVVNDYSPIVNSILMRFYDINENLGNDSSSSEEEEEMEQYELRQVSKHIKMPKYSDDENYKQALTKIINLKKIQKLNTILYKDFDGEQQALMGFRIMLSVHYTSDELNYFDNYIEVIKKNYEHFESYLRLRADRNVKDKRYQQKIASDYFLWKEGVDFMKVNESLSIKVKGKKDTERKRDKIEEIVGNKLNDVISKIESDKTITINDGLMHIINRKIQSRKNQQERMERKVPVLSSQKRLMMGLKNIVK